MSVFTAWGIAGNPGDVPHFDHRNTPHLQINPAHQPQPGLVGEARAFNFLRANAAIYQLEIENLAFTKAKESLLATHYHYQQMLNGFRVHGGEIVVSFDHETGRIVRVYNNIYPAKSAPANLPSVQLDREDAFDVAWHHLRVSGELLYTPGAELVYMPQGTDFHLVWMVDLHVAAPMGEWRTLIDAVYGKVIDSQDRRLNRLPVKRQPSNEAVIDRQMAFASYQSKQRKARQEQEARRGKAGLADGTGIVFDPDPRTTLNDESITDNSPAAAFTDAYLTRPLNGLALDGGIYRLNGPWITISDWDPPTNAPSTTMDGNWTALRGNNAFNDAMTYFHIHQSQVYIQSLGFTGAKGIQEGSIVTDTDGANGDDNSFYFSGSNRMTFGHGCVDDNEDMDVILHEYGHAIHHSINSSWGGGDSGAIGEGFGDYWAGSYSYSTPNGPIFHPEWVYSWDGHSNCWAGRFLNKTNLMYDPSRTYGAHVGITGGVSDELWSAPIFSALLDLIGMGRPRAEMDQIVLESHFGLGSGVTMRVLGNSTVAAAANLFPGGPHADVYQSRFLAQNIIEAPFIAMETGDVTILTEPSGNGAPDPLETFTFALAIKNTGNLTATQVRATLTSNNPDIVVNSGLSDYPDLGAGASGENVTPFSVTLEPGLFCAVPIGLELVIDWFDGTSSGSAPFHIHMVMGVPFGLLETRTPNLPINDNSTIQDVITTTSTQLVTPIFNIDVDISHTFIGDLTVTLQAPNGTQVILHNGTGGNASNIIGNYPNTLTPAQPLDPLFWEPQTGDWTLIVTDDENGDQGTLNSWGLTNINGHICDVYVPCIGDLNSDGTVNEEDYAIAMANWTTPEGDVNGNGMGTILDLIEIREAFGSCD